MQETFMIKRSARLAVDTKELERKANFHQEQVERIENIRKENKNILLLQYSFRITHEVLHFNIEKCWKIRIRLTYNSEKIHRRRIVYLS